jgi:hypothetical protein
MQSSNRVEIVAYEQAHREPWNAFAQAAKNGHFFFQRGFMDYHADRFQDASLLFYAGHRLIALLPANVSGSDVFSHQGLTYGGLLVDHAMTAGLMLDVFDAMCDFLRARGTRRLLYKPVPYLYFREPSQEVEDVAAGKKKDPFGRDFTTKPPLAPPYRVVKVMGALFHTQGGLEVNKEMRVLRKDGTPFPNLYAGGGAARGLSGPADWGYLSGSGLMTATNMGRLAGEAAAALVRK